MKKLISIVTALSAALSMAACGSSDSSTSDSAQEKEVVFDVVKAENTQQYVEQMGIGWNLGNTLDPGKCNWIDNDLDYETAWGNPKTTKEMISYIKSEGFDTIRIPVTWNDHIDKEYNINKEWFDRVQEVVDWCVEEDMFIILNIHHDGDWLIKASTDYDNVMKKYKAIWTQIADRFGNYNEKLIFESMNEVGFDDLGTKKGCELISKINGEFTSLIRDSGKHNKERYLLLAGYWTDIDRTCESGYTLPDDDRIMLSVHYYSPADFAIADAKSTWGYRETWGDQDGDMEYLDGQFEKLKTHFVDKGIPVIIGEYGAAVKDKDEASRILWFESVTKTALKYGCCPVVWDNGEIIDRTGLGWKTEGLKDAIMGAKGTQKAAA